jgi:hypothetical protein
VDQALKALHLLPVFVLDAEDQLLTAERFSIRAEHLFVHVKTGEPRLIYGLAGEKTPFREQYGGLLDAAGAMDHVVGLPAAARQIQERLCRENPDLSGLIRIAEEVRREWSYIQPVL